MVDKIKQPTGILMINGARNTNRYTPPQRFNFTNLRFFLLNFFTANSPLSKPAANDFFQTSPFEIGST